MRTLRPLLHPVAALASLTAATTLLAASPQDYVGEWAFTLPGGGAGWLGVTQQPGYYDASYLWGWGSVTPAESVFFSDGTLMVIRLNEVKRRDASGKVVRTHRFPEVLMGQLEEGELVLTRLAPRANGESVERQRFSGKKLPPMPPAPDLTQVKFGPAISLFNGQNLDGWRLVEPNGANGWSAEGGLLINRPVQVEGQPHKNYGNLRTDREFEDFNLTCEVRVPKGGNSGIYLRGIYEVQVADTHGKPIDPHNMGGIYSRIAPSESAEKPAGEWQTYDITLVNRHVTVILNGKKVVANQPVPGPTGGALWPEVDRPGPLYLQGDHTGVDYRNLVVRPVVK
jgi:hypothetical protein